MLHGRRPWREELAIIDRVLRTVSDITDPQEMVRAYWNGISELLPIRHYLALSRRGVEPPAYLITRSSRFAEPLNPWTERDRLPRMTGGLLGEIAYANQPVVIEDLPERVRSDDPGRFYLEGFQSLVALPHYEGGQGVNVGISLFLPGAGVDQAAIPMMHWQAGLFGRGTQNLVLRNQLATALRSLDREQQVVGEIQRSLLPPQLPSIPGLELAAYYRTSARAGGDYYDFLPLGDDDWGFMIADVSGKGTPAAVLMAITHAIAHTRPGAPSPPREVLAHLNRHLSRTYTRSKAFVTAFYATLCPARRHLAHSTAGHNPPRLVRDGHIVPLSEDGGLPLGITADEQYAESRTALQPGDLLLFYTDGITEAMAPRGPSGTRELFGLERLDAVLVESAPANVADCLNRICTALDAFTGGAPPADDQTLVGIRCL